MRRPRTLAAPALRRAGRTSWSGAVLLVGSLALASCASARDARPILPPPPARAEEPLAEDVPRSEKTVLEALWDAEKTLRARQRRIEELEQRVAELEAEVTRLKGLERGLVGAKSRGD